ncbi:MAG: serine hydrolase domain-containing protein, partial [Gemmatimonadota bacterium]
MATFRAMRGFHTMVVTASLCFASSALAQQAVVDSMVTSFIKRHNIPGASVAAVHRGQTVVAGGYGTANLELNVSADRATVYEIGSISKLFTVAALMRLVDEGKVSLGDPITKYVPGLPAAWSDVTLRHLAAHTGGAPDWESRTAFSYRATYADSDFVRLVAALPLDFKPGERFAYTNTGAPLLGIAIARASGMSFERFVTEQLIYPVNAPGLRYKHQKEIVPRRAGGYIDSAGTLLNGEPHRPEIIAPS